MKTLMLKQKDYSLKEAFGPEFPANRHIMGFEDCNFPFVPRRNPLWHWDRDVLRDLMQWWQDDSSFDGLILFGPHGAGKSGALRQFCSALKIPHYGKGMHDKVQFDELITYVGLAGGSVIPSYAWIPLAMGAEGYPGIFCVNELDRGKPGILTGLHDVLDGEPLPVQLGALDCVVPSPYFRIAATTNTAMSGDPTGLYPTAKRQDIASVDRFIFIKVNYLKEDEERALLEQVVPALNPRIRTDMVTVANLIRKSFMGETGVPNDSQSAPLDPNAPNAAGTQVPRPPEQRLPMTMSTRVLLRWARKALAFRDFQAYGRNPVWYALDRVLLNAASSMPEVQIAIKEIAEGVLGPDPVAS